WPTCPRVGNWRKPTHEAGRAADADLKNPMPVAHLGQKGTHEGFSGSLLAARFPKRPEICDYFIGQRAMRPICDQPFRHVAESLRGRDFHGLLRLLVDE